MSTRMVRGRPHREKTRRNKARASWGGIVCHWAWGGKLGRQQRTGVRVDGGHPTDFGAGLEPFLFDGVHLPEVVGRLGSGSRGAWPLGPSGTVDPLSLEGPLQCPCRGDEGGGEEPKELDADSAAAPGGVLSLELTGPTQDVAAVPRRGTATGLIADGQAIVPLVAEGAPQVADGGQGEEEIGRDLKQGVACQVTVDDLVASGERDGARHGGSSESLGTDAYGDFRHAHGSGV